MAECIDLSIIDSPVSTKAVIETVEPGHAHDMPKKSLSYDKKKKLESKIATLTTSLSTVQSRIAALEKQLRPLKARQQSLIDHINSINEQLDFLPRSKVLHFFRSSAHASEQVNQRCLPFLQDGQWSKPTKWDNKIAQVMRNVFGIFGGFRHHQKEAINAAMSGADVRLHLHPLSSQEIAI